MLLYIGEDESFSLTANVTNPGPQRLGLSGFLVRKTRNGTYVASLLPQMFYGVDGSQLTSWRQTFTQAGEQVVLSRAAGGYPKVPDEEIYWRKVAEPEVAKEEVEDVVSPTYVPWWQRRFGR